MMQNKHFNLELPNIFGYFFKQICLIFCNYLIINEMTGQELKEKLAADGIVLSDLAAMLGFSDQRLHSALRAADIKTGLLESIATALNKSVCYFYGDEANKNVSSMTAINAELIRLRAENDLLRELAGLDKKGKKNDNVG